MWKFHRQRITDYLLARVWYYFSPIFSGWIWISSECGESVVYLAKVLPQPPDSERTAPHFCLFDKMAKESDLFTFLIMNKAKKNWLVAVSLVSLFAVVLSCGVKQSKTCHCSSVTYVDDEVFDTTESDFEITTGASCVSLYLDQTSVDAKGRTIRIVRSCN